jgi:hypothetical protein
MSEVAAEALAHLFERADADSRKSSRVFNGILKERLNSIAAEFAGSNPICAALHASEGARAKVKEADEKAEPAMQAWLSLITTELARNPLQPGTPAAAALDHLTAIAIAAVTSGNAQEPAGTATDEEQVEEAAAPKASNAQELEAVWDQVQGGKREQAKKAAKKPQPSEGR